jgi:hypothetical protein
MKHFLVPNDWEIVLTPTVVVVVGRPVRRDGGHKCRFHVAGGGPTLDWAVRKRGATPKGGYLQGGVCLDLRQTNDPNTNPTCTSPPFPYCTEKGGPAQVGLVLGAWRGKGQGTPLER